MQSPADGVTDGVAITSDRTALAARVTSEDSPVTVRALGETQRSGVSASAGIPTLTLVAQVEPPVVRGTVPQPDGSVDHYELPLQATHVVIRGETAVVSYHQIDDVFAGAVDVFDISDPAAPALISHAAFEFLDANSVTVSDDAVYVAGSTWNPEAAPFTAVVDRFALTSGGLTATDAKRWGLIGHVATGVALDGDVVYASSGNAGELAILGEDESVHVGAGLARWIDARDGVTAALIGGDDQPAFVRVVNPADLATVLDIEIPGADTIDAKNTLQVSGTRGYVAAGQAGLHVVDLSSGALLQQRMLPIDSGHAPEDVATNSVSRDGDLVFTANGALGAWIARTNADGTVETLGALALGTSANHVAYADGWLFVAGGTGGLQIIRVTDIEPPYACTDGDDAPHEFITASPGAPIRDGDHLYWGRNGHVWKASVFDGVPHAMAPGDTARIAFDDTYVYWVEEVPGNVKRVHRDTGVVEVLASGQSAATSIAVTADHVYWGQISGGKETAQVRRLPLSGGPVELIDSGFNGPAWYMQADATHLYYTAFYSGAVFRKPLSGGPREVVAQRGGAATYLQLKGDYVYFTAGHSCCQIPGLGHVSRAPKDGSGPLETIIEVAAPSNPRGLALDDEFVYWTHADGAVRRAPLDFVSYETLANEGGAPFGPAVDSAFVFWYDSARNAIRRMCK